MTDLNRVQFYYNPMSRGRIVHWMLEECKAEYDIIAMDWAKNSHKSPDYLKINPMGQIPAIMHKGVVVTETAAICAYLADAYPHARLAPEIDSPLRGTYYRWLFFAASDIEPAFLDKSNPRTPQVSSSHLGYGSYADVVNTMEIAISKGYLVGDRFSAADIYMASQIEWSLLVRQLEPRPIFTSYLNLCRDRAGYRSYIKKAGSINL